MSDISGMRVLKDGEWVPLSRIATLRDKAITASSYFKSVVEPTIQVIVADADSGDKCPPATQDIGINLQNRQKAIDTAEYGPLNPKEPNDDFWQAKADRWKVSIDEAKKSRCGNCVMFIRTPKMLDCIEGGLAAGDSGAQNAWDAIDTAELGYCEAFDFKCAASRTCNAWVVGGPITEDKSAITSAGILVPEEQDLADALRVIVKKHGKFNEDNTGVWAGYDSAEKNAENAAIGVKCGNCVFWEAPNGCEIISHETEEGGLCRFAVLPDGAVTATAGSKPAPKKDQIKGSDKNAKGSASGSKTITFSKKVEESLKAKVEEFNKTSNRKASLGMLKAVYRRGAGAFSSSHRPDQNRNSWAMGRVNAFLHLLKSGSPKNSKYTTDNDLLPASHPKSSKKKSVTASGESFPLDETGTEVYEYDYSGELTIVLLPETEYTSREQATFALAEYSDAGYEIIPALDAAWSRAINSKKNGFDRAKELATSLQNSRDADLLPKEF